MIIFWGVWRSFVEIGGPGAINRVVHHTSHQSRGFQLLLPLKCGQVCSSSCGRPVSKNVDGEFCVLACPVLCTMYNTKVTISMKVLSCFDCRHNLHLSSLHFFDRQQSRSNYTMNENKEATTSQPPRYANLVHSARAPRKKRSGRSRSPNDSVPKNDRPQPNVEPGDNGNMKPAAKQ